MKITKSVDALRRLLKDRITKVTNMRDMSFQLFSLRPEDAVCAAYAQSIGDWNTWAYAAHKSNVEHGKYHVFCGDFAARIDGE